ncbi:hypothetical protein FPHOBKDP_00088 [Listeria phage LPJP1]|nr:hypothetical protein FPHOBKDP_00088 [Listeria phage LPJP1]
MKKRPIPNGEEKPLDIKIKKPKSRNFKMYILNANIDIIKFDKNEIHINIDREILPYQRHRFNIIGSTYDPLGGYKNEFRKILIKSINEYNSVHKNKIPFNENAFEGPIELESIFSNIPTKFGNSLYKIYLMLTNQEKRIKKPDIDNYQKTLMDLLNKILWKDDNQVYRLISEKRYNTHPETNLIIRFKENPNSKNIRISKELKKTLDDDILDLAMKIKNNEINSELTYNPEKELEGKKIQDDL